jgi:hypothetical protein
MRIFVLAATAGAAALGLSGPTAADNTQLIGNVGPGYSISLHDAAGNAITQPNPGPTPFSSTTSPTYTTST